MWRDINNCVIPFLPHASVLLQIITCSPLCLVISEFILGANLLDFLFVLSFDRQNCLELELVFYVSMGWALGLEG